MAEDETDRKTSILETKDTFIAAVPWGESRKALVFCREHGGRKYVKVRTWNCHRTEHVWYPTVRFYVIPVENAASLAETLVPAAQGMPLQKKPQWYADREQADYERYDQLLDLGIPEEALVHKKRRIERRRRRRV